MEIEPNTDLDGLDQRQLIPYALCHQEFEDHLLPIHALHQLELLTQVLSGALL